MYTIKLHYGDVTAIPYLTYALQINTEQNVNQIVKWAVEISPGKKNNPPSYRYLYMIHRLYTDFGITADITGYLGDDFEIKVESSDDYIKLLTVFS